MQSTAEKLDIAVTRHVARHFDALPGIQRSLALLDEIATADLLMPPVSTDMPIALYGAGNLGSMAREFLRAVWLNFDFVIDRNASALRDHPAWSDTQIYA